MKYLKILFVALLINTLTTSCNSDNDVNNAEKIDDDAKKGADNKKVELKPQTFKNLLAPKSGTNFIKFNLSEGKIVEGDNWDIAFKGTAIAINGGTKKEAPTRTKECELAIVKSTFTEIKKVKDEFIFKTDTETELALKTGSGNGWYTYTGSPTHLINPISGTILVIKTHNGHYAKIEILSYYPDSIPSMMKGGSYTFNYVLNPIKGDKNL